MKILITGDFAINREYFKSNINDAVTSLFNQSDLNIVNLEAPVTSSCSKILKTGPHLKSDKESTLQGLKSLEVDVVTLAHNHVLDYDEQGVSDTLDFCKENGIKTVGTGMNLKEASRTLYLDSKEGRLAFINFAENEWASATDKSAGANPMDIIDNSKQIKKAKENADFVFVIVHGGHEFYNLPSPRMQKQYRFYAEQGADIIIGHHTHCISGFEVYNGVPIYFSLGNFLFTSQSTFQDWYNGLILGVEIKNGKLSTQLFPVKQHEGTFEVSLLKNEEKKAILDRISSYNTIILDEMNLKYEWNKYIETKYDSYLNYWSPLSFISNRYIKGILNKMGIKLINKKGIALALNLMRCEAHVDISKGVTKKYLKK